MCYKTSKFSRDGGSKGNKNEDSKGRNKSNSKSRRDYSSDDSDHNKKKSKSRSKKDHFSDEDDKRRGKSKKDEKKSSKSSRYKHAASSEESEDDDAVAAYYAVRIDKNKGMTVTQQNGSENGRYDSSSESTSTTTNNIKRPNIDAPAPAKGILKKVASNPSLAKLDGMSEVSGAVSEVGYITNKLTKRLQARGQRDVLEPIDVKQRMESSSDDIWQQERDNWSRQKEELKAWAQSQGNESSPKVQRPPAAKPNVFTSIQMLPTRELNPMAEQMVPPSNGMGRMYRTMSGLSLADQHEALLSNHGSRRNSEQVGVGAVGGKKSFRSKRFSRNVEREPGSLKRAQSFHMDQRDDSEFWHDSQRRPFARLEID